MAYSKQYVTPYVARHKVIGDTDYVMDGKVIVGANTSSVMVNSESDLAQLADYAPGSIAYTPGFAKVWQLNADGEWVMLGGE